MYQFSYFKRLTVFASSKVFFFTINAKRGSMFAGLAYCITARTGVVFRQVCCCTKLTGLSRASISYMAKFLAACTLCSRRDFQVFNYLSSYPCNQDFLLFKNFLSFLLIFYSKYYRAKPSLQIISLFIRYNPLTKLFSLPREALLYRERKKGAFPIPK